MEETLLALLSSESFSLSDFWRSATMHPNSPFLNPPLLLRLFSPGSTALRSSTPLHSSQLNHPSKISPLFSGLSSPSKRTYTLIVAMDGTGKGCCPEQELTTDAHKVLDIMSLLRVHPDETTFGYLVYLYATKGLEHKMIELQDLVSRFNLPNKSIFIRCDQMFFSEIMKEDSDIMGCISSRVRHLVHLHCKTALRKSLKKYDKVHNSVSGVNFMSKMQAEPGAEPFSWQGGEICKPKDEVFGNPGCITELDLLLKRRFRKEWEERLTEH
ncbi:unnamed protein product [Lactuca virosa]|uniref:Uncharacterized protein n=1 Tax=Lactuca virosa TaxID=75947 RepID=A0AAU9LMZ4_9ASTR|nr:unnamed protein product [Lactuca virosa]